MGDPMQELVTALRRVLALDAPAANDGAREWVALDAEAKARGKATRQFRAWCVSHEVEIRQGGHKDAWVRPADVDRAIAGFTPVPTRRRESDELDAAMEAARQRRRR